MTIHARLLAWIETRDHFTRSETVRRFRSIKPGTIDYYLHALVAAGCLCARQVRTDGSTSCWQYRIYTRTCKSLATFQFPRGASNRKTASACYSGRGNKKT